MVGLFKMLEIEFRPTNIIQTPKSKGTTGLSIMSTSITSTASRPECETNELVCTRHGKEDRTMDW